MLEIFSKELYVGLEVPEDIQSAELSEDLDALIPGRWKVEAMPASSLAESEKHQLMIEVPWGHIPAFPHDFIVVDHLTGQVGVLPHTHFKSQRLKRSPIPFKEQT